MPPRSVENSSIVATRAATFDLLANRYLDDHPDATVLHVGCGMDSRVFRVDPPASVQWFDVDYPDVIELRRRLFPERATYRRGGAALPERNGGESPPQCGGRSLPRRSGDLRYLQSVDCEESGLERRGHGCKLQMGSCRSPGHQAA